MTANTNAGSDRSARTSSHAFFSSTPQALAVPAAQLQIDLAPLLSDEERRFQRWRWGWSAFYGTLAVGCLVALPFVSAESRIDYYAGAVTSAAAIPLTLLFAQPPLPNLDAKLDASDRRRLLEARAHEVAAYQRDAGGWQSHLGNVIGNGLLAGFLGLGYGRWETAGVDLVLGTVIGTLQILTHPRRVARFQEGTLSEFSPPTTTSAQLPRLRLHRAKNLAAER